MHRGKITAADPRRLQLKSHVNPDGTHEKSGIQIHKLTSTSCINRDGQQCAKESPGQSTAATTTQFYPRKASKQSEAETMHNAELNFSRKTSFRCCCALAWHTLHFAYIRKKTKNKHANKQTTCLNKTSLVPTVHNLLEP